MTDLEMDLMIANTRIAILQKALDDAQSRRSVKGCSFGPGITIKPDGVNELDPCSFEQVEVHRNVTVEVLRCKKCGKTEVLWHRQEDTEDGDCDG